MYYHIVDFEPYCQIAGSNQMVTSMSVWDSEISKIACVEDVIEFMNTHYPYIQDYKIIESLLPYEEFNEVTKICED